MDITIEQLEQVLDSWLEPINTRLDTIEQIFASHTATLDVIVKQTKDWNA